MRGSQCPYRHSRTVSDTVCKHWLRGLCKKETTCEYVHEYDLSRMPLCQFFQTYGTCGNPGMYHSTCIIILFCLILFLPYRSIIGLLTL
jgi:hypothetical protein